MLANSYLKSFLENLDDIVFIINYPSLTFKYISPSVKARGYTPEEIYADPKLMYQGLDAGFRDSLLRIKEYHLVPGKQMVFEYPYTLRTGEQRWYSNAMFLVNISESEQVLAGIIRDITNSKKTEHELERLKLLYEDFYNKAPNGYHSLDENGRFVRINDTELAWLGYTREELLGEHFAEKLLTPASKITFRENFPKLLKAGVLTQLQLELIRKDGTVMICQLNATIFKDELTGKMRTRSILTDITEMKLKKEKLQQARLETEALNTLLNDTNLKLERLNFTKDVLLKIVSHDLRNPLVTISMITNLLQEKYEQLDPETMLKYLNYLQETSQQASHILEDMVGVVNLDDKNIHFQFAESRILDVIHEALAVSLRQSSVKGLKLHFDVPQEVQPLMVNVDAKWLVRALDNIISNAIKFSNKGSEVRISCQKLDNQVAIRIQDSGIGMPEDVYKTLLSDIVVKSRQGTDGEMGTGLGLSIVKQIMDMQKGSIKIESREGSGTTVELNLPLVTELEYHNS